MDLGNFGPNRPVQYHHLNVLLWNILLVRQVHMAPY